MHLLSCFGVVVLRRHSQRRLSGLGEGDAPGIQQAEAINAAKYPLLHRTGPTTKSYLVQNAEVEKPCFRIAVLNLYYCHLQAFWGTRPVFTLGDYAYNHKRVHGPASVYL